VFQLTHCRVQWRFFFQHDNKLSGSIKAGNLLTNWVTIKYSRKILRYGSSLYVHTVDINAFSLAGDDVSVSSSTLSRNHLK